MNAFKGFSFKNMFGKRSLNSHVQESVGAHMDALVSYSQLQARAQGIDVNAPTTIQNHPPCLSTKVKAYSIVFSPAP